ncbi:hypothetical protein B0H14DRAFT_3428387 [Mycena olivaceomarginata]|nr:hypothetical protein B0H14DRAFT_3428387 [Mycena olivaceomarginata]
MPLDQWMMWVAMVRNLSIEIHRLGNGAPRIGDGQFKCTGCESCDHPTGMCPLPSNPGWFGPSLASLDVDDKTFISFDDGGRGGRSVHLID